jgi:hypothetical protein
MKPGRARLYDRLMQPGRARLYERLATPKENPAEAGFFVAA